MRMIAVCVTGLLTVAIAFGQETQPQKVHVFVTILPQAYFVERIGGDAVDVSVLVGPGQSPHSYDVTPKQLESLGRAKLYFRVGVDAENSLIPRIERMFHDMKVIDTRDGVTMRKFADDEAGCEHKDGDKPEGEHKESKESKDDGHKHEEGKHEDDHDHSAGKPDPHIWLSPTLVKTQAETICKALCEIDAARADMYRKNLAAFKSDLDGLHKKLSETLAPLKGRSIFVFHPAFGYFTDTYGLKQVAVEVEGKEPSAKQVTALINRAKADNVKVIFVQPQFSGKTAEAVAQAIGGAVVPMDDLPRDYMKAMETMAEKIQKALVAK